MRAFPILAALLVSLTGISAGSGARAQATSPNAPANCGGDASVNCAIGFWTLNGEAHIARLDQPASYRICLNKRLAADGQAVVQVLIDGRPTVVAGAPLTLPSNDAEQACAVVRGRWIVLVSRSNLPLGKPPIQGTYERLERPFVSGFKWAFPLKTERSAILLTSNDVRRDYRLCTGPFDAGGAEKRYHWIVLEGGYFGNAYDRPYNFTAASCVDLTAGQLGVSGLGPAGSAQTLKGFIAF